MVSLCRSISLPSLSQDHSLIEKSLLLRNVITGSLPLDKSLGDVSSVSLLQNELSACKSVPSAKGVCTLTAVSWKCSLLLHYQCCLFCFPTAFHLWSRLFLEDYHFGYSGGMCAEKHHWTAICSATAFESTSSVQSTGCLKIDVDHFVGSFENPLLLPSPFGYEKGFYIV